MRVCPNCGRENPDNRDFCVCGEYLRWEPTQHIAAVDPSVVPGVGQAQEHAHAGGAPAPGPVDPELTLPGAPAVVAAQPGAAEGIAGPPVVRPEVAAGPPPGAATLLLRRADDEEQTTGPVSASVTPGERTVLVGLIRNESGIVDNYDIAVRGLPAGWWTVAPATVYLVPFGTSGNYEQEFQVHLHPPRSPEAQAQPWSYEVTAFSRAYDAEVAAAPATVEIEPYQEVSGKVTPDR
ncbi:MAG TPA: zinc ribbon domain-containing protein, partial [Mycobacterium sp.]|nr:zinc ribbon domain-containing protein [Mycobacterium sp.]